MTITDDYKIFADKYHNKQHIENPELRIQKLEEEIKELKKKEIAELKEIEEENKELKEDLQHTKDCSWDYYTELLKLRKENKKLKRRIEEDHKAVPSFLIKDLYLDATEENKKLKEENKKLKELVGSIKKETDKAK